MGPRMFHKHSKLGPIPKFRNHFFFSIAETSHGTLKRLITSAPKGAMCGSIPLSARASTVTLPRSDAWVTQRLLNFGYA